MTTPFAYHSFQDLSMLQHQNFTPFRFCFSHFSPVLLFCNPVDCSPPGSSVHGTSQARILEWVAISFSGSLASSRPRDRTCVSCIGRPILCYWATREAHAAYTVVQPSPESITPKSSLVFVCKALLRGILRSLLGGCCPFCR